MKNLKNLSIITLLVTSFSLTGCFNILEEITLRKDGSGSYRFTLDGKEIKHMAEGFGKQLTGKSPEPDSTQSPTDTLPRLDKFAGLKSIKGISNVQQIEDKSTMSMGVTFDFSNLQSLQQVMDSLGSNKAFGSFGVGRSLKFDGKKLERGKGSSIRDILAGIMHQQSNEKGGPDMSNSAGFMKMIFGSMTFTQVYHFPDRKIKKCNQKDAEISQDKHDLTLIEHPFKDDPGDKKNAAADLLIRLK